MNHKIFKIGMIGAGAISDIYITNIQTKFKYLELVAISANHLENAEKKAEKYSLTACTTEELLRREDIEIVVVLTPVATHYALIKQALNANKHVYTEKTICETTKQAEELLKLAEEKKLVLGCAPDTFLGSSVQTALKAVQEGLIGDIHSFNIAINRNNDILTSMFPFLRIPGAGILRDYVVYYLTALCTLLGPVESVAAQLRAPYKKRTCILPQSPDFGKEIDTPNESILAATVQMKNGIIGTLHDDSESAMMYPSVFNLYGSKGVLVLGNPNNFGDPVYFCKALPESFSEPQKPEELPFVNSYADNMRGLGAAEMSLAIQNREKHCASADLAIHVLDVIEAIECSSTTGRFETVRSDFESSPLLKSL